jgi:hypothetical protein
MKYIKDILIIQVILFSLIFSSCTTANDDLTLIQNKIEERLLFEANDPNSYSFVEIQVVDTLYYGEIINSAIESLEREIVSKEEMIQSNKELIERMGQLADETNLRNDTQRYQGQLDEIKKQKDKLLSFESNHEGIMDDIAYMRIFYSHRENNSMGALELFRNEYEVRVLSENEVEIMWSADYETAEMLRNADTFDENWMIMVEEVFSGNAREVILNEIGVNL